MITFQSWQLLAEAKRGAKNLDRVKETFLGVILSDQAVEQLQNDKDFKPTMKDIEAIKFEDPTIKAVAKYVGNIATSMKHTTQAYKWLDADAKPDRVCEKCNGKGYTHVGIGDERPSIKRFMQTKDYTTVPCSCQKEGEWRWYNSTQGRNGQKVPQNLIPEIEKKQIVIKNPIKDTYWCRYDEGIRNPQRVSVAEAEELDERLNKLTARGYPNEAILRLIDSEELMTTDIGTGREAMTPDLEKAKNQLTTAQYKLLTRGGTSEFIKKHPDAWGQLLPSADEQQKYADAIKKLTNFGLSKTEIGTLLSLYHTKTNTSKTAPTKVLSIAGSNDELKQAIQTQIDKLKEKGVTNKEAMSIFNGVFADLPTKIPGLEPPKTLYTARPAHLPPKEVGKNTPITRHIPSEEISAGKFRMNLYQHSPIGAKEVPLVPVNPYTSHMYFCPHCGKQTMATHTHYSPDYEDQSQSEKDILSDKPRKFKAYTTGIDQTVMHTGKTLATHAYKTPAVTKKKCMNCGESFYPEDEISDPKLKALLKQNNLLGQNVPQHTTISTAPQTSKGVFVPTGDFNIKSPGGDAIGQMSDDEGN